jgi:hypothetical protein
MAHCEHGNESTRCGLCVIERRIDQFGDSYNGLVGTRGTKVSQINYDAEDDCSPCEEAYNDEMMKDFVLNSFGAQYESEEDGGDFTE